MYAPAPIDPGAPPLGGYYPPPPKPRAPLFAGLTGAAVLLVVMVGIPLGVGLNQGDDTASFQQQYQQILASDDFTNCSSSAYSVYGQDDEACDAVIVDEGTLAENTDLDDPDATDSLEAARASFEEYESEDCLGSSTDACDTEGGSVLTNVGDAYSATGGQ